MNAKFSTSSLLIHLLVFCFLFLALSAPALPRLGGASLKQGNSQLKFSRAAARLSWNIENPDPTPATVTLQIKPEGTQGEAIYSRVITIPAKTHVEGSYLVVINNVTRFLIELLHDKTRIDKDDILVRPNTARRLNIAVLDDNTESTGTSEIIRHKELEKVVTFTTFRQVTIPDHWAEFQSFDLLVILRPDIHLYSTAQMLAVRDFVMQGGCVVLASPQAALQIGATMLHDFISATPVAETTLPDPNLLSKSFGLQPLPTPPDRNQDGFLANNPRPDFLIMEKSAQTTPIIEYAGRPIINLRRLGTGTIVMLAFDPFQAGKADKRLIAPIWNSLFRHCNYMPNIVSPDFPGKTNQTLQLLQGYSIPPVAVIVQIFLFYVCGGVIILGVCFHFHRQSLGWLLLCAYGLLITLLVFHRSRDISSNQSNHTITTIATSVWDGEPGPTYATSLLFSKNDCRPTVAADSNRTFFQAQPPGPLVREAGTLVSSPLWITSDKKSTRLERLSLQQNRPRALVWSHSQDGYGAAPTARPILSIQDDGRGRLQPWKLPPPLAGASRAALVFPKHHRVIEIQNDTVVDTGTAGRLEADTVFTCALDYISSLPRQHPCLALISTNSQTKNNPVQITAESQADTFNAYNYIITFVPVNLEQQQAQALGQEFFSWQLPDKSLLRSYFRYGNWENVLVQTSTQNDYTIDFNVLPEAFPQKCERIAITLDMIVPGNHTNFNVNLLTLNGSLLQPSEQRGQTFVFDTAGQNVISQRQQRFHAIIKTTSEHQIKPGSLPSSRTLFWKVANLSAQANFASTTNNNNQRP